MGFGLDEFDFFQRPHGLQYFGLAKETEVRLEVFDLTGRKVGSPFAEFLQKGSQRIELGARDFEKRDGVYLIKLRLGEETHTLKVLYLGGS